MSLFRHTISFRVRYSETDQMGTFYNSRALEWFECGRSELMRAMGIPYALCEEKGLFLPLVESFVKYQGRARYDDLLELTTSVSFEGRIKLRCDACIVHSNNRQAVASGHTIHAITNNAGKPMRPPEWFVRALSGNSSPNEAT